MKSKRIKNKTNRKLKNTVLLLFKKWKKEKNLLYIFQLYKTR